MNEDEVELTEAESQFFAMDDNEKIEYLIENPYEKQRLELMQSYIFELAENEEFEKLQEFYNRFIKKHDDIFVVHSLMGLVYMEHDLDLAESYLKKAWKKCDEHEAFSEEAKDEFKKDFEYLLEKIDEMKKEDK